jgi:hypothetical protein
MGTTDRAPLKRLRLRPHVNARLNEHSEAMNDFAMSQPQRIPEPRCPDVAFHYGAHWQIATLFAVVGFMHLAVALPLIRLHRWEGWLGLGLANLSLIASLVAAAWERELAVRASLHQLRLREGIGRFRNDRSISFDQVREVKLMLVSCKRGIGARVSLECAENLDIELPPLASPRAEALLLAITLNVPVTTVSDEASRITLPARRRPAGWLFRRRIESLSIDS